MDVTPGGRRSRLAKWIAPAALVVGLAALAFAASRSIADRSPFEFGLLYVVWRYEQALPLAGLGLALAQMRRRMLILNAAVFAVGLPLGGFVANWIAAAFAAGVDIYDSLLLIGPGCLAITGLALVSPAVVRAWLLPPATLASAIVLGMVMNFSDPTVEEQTFAAGAVLCGVWLVATPYLLRRRFERPWFSIPARIFGSWLVAIGVMLGALYVIPPPDHRQAPPPGEESPSPGGAAEPGAPDE